MGPTVFDAITEVFRFSEHNFGYGLRCVCVRGYKERYVRVIGGEEERDGTAQAEQKLVLSECWRKKYRFKSGQQW
ncbi:unnamed protein product [Strongylus vulgaris]|uniref:Uncharacterized protein n=1 Tax=Strongylus vulgaris TaxID=40348 RepID=A0A3P7KPZ6_STRVU|nr:unnamed protein product [Strongylus vulgaris]